MPKSYVAEIIEQMGRVPMPISINEDEDEIIHYIWQPISDQITSQVSFAICLYVFEDYLF